MTNATAQQHIATSAGQIRWGRIVIGAVLLEAVLIVAAIPLLGFVANPLAPGAQNASGDYTIFFVSVTVACFVVGALAGWWVARPLSSQFMLHGALTGIVATAIYLLVLTVYFNRGKWVANVLTSVLFSLCSYLMFTKLLGVTLAPGILPI